MSAVTIGSAGLRVTRYSPSLSSGALCLAGQGPVSHHFQACSLGGEAPGPRGPVEGHAVTPESSQEVFGP